MSKLTIRYKLWSALNRITYRICILIKRIHMYTNNRVLHCNKLEWIHESYLKVEVISANKE